MAATGEKCRLTREGKAGKPGREPRGHTLRVKSLKGGVCSGGEKLGGGGEGGVPGTVRESRLSQWGYTCLLSIPFHIVAFASSASMNALNCCYFYLELVLEISR